MGDNETSAWELIGIARRWFPGLKSAEFRESNYGYASLNWTFDYSGKKYLLKRFLGFKTKAMINSEYRITKRVVEGGFPYKIPHALESVSGKPYFEYKNYLYSMYEYLPGKADMEVTESDAYEIGRMAALLHNIIATKRFEAKRRSGYQTIDSINKRLAKAIADKNPEHKRLNGILKSSYFRIKPILDGIDLSHYKRQKAYPVHDDIAPDNMLWLDGKIYALIDFANMANYRDSLLMDIAWAVHFCCLNKGTRKSYKKGHIERLLQGYSEIRTLSRKDRDTVASLVIVTNSSDMEFAYYKGLNANIDKEGVKWANKIRQQVATSKWVDRNRHCFQAKSR
ncbi:MAG: phosphotransferase [Candidatus Marsarchaeota archaeon]|nr:phosphotransferase [Candidatus Marsarchaeota archaeon]